jgi:hypothetical protein
MSQTELSLTEGMKEQLLYRFSKFTKDELIEKLLKTDDIIERNKLENNEWRNKILEQSKELLLKFLYPNLKI